MIFLYPFIIKAAKNKEMINITIEDLSPKKTINNNDEKIKNKNKFLSFTYLVFIIKKIISANNKILANSHLEPAHHQINLLFVFWDF